MAMWLILALLSALTAALVAIFGKLGLKGVDTTLATAVRSVIMAVFLVSAAGALGKFQGFSLSTFDGKGWLYIILAGVAGALSWLFYFWALKLGPAGAVAAIDRLSIVFVVIVAALVLGEAFTKYTGAGALLVVAGALLIAFDSKAVAYLGAVGKGVIAFFK
jgi:bacterial/archaeal transporter family protein